MLRKHSLLLFVGFIGIVLVSTGLFFNPFNHHSLINNSVNDSIASNNSSVDSNNDSIDNSVVSSDITNNSIVDSGSITSAYSNSESQPSVEPDPVPNPEPEPDPPISDGNYNFSHLLFDIKYSNVTDPISSLEYFNNSQHDSLIASLFIDNGMLSNLINGNFLSGPLLFDDGYIHRNLIGDISRVTLIVKNGTYFFDTIYI
jgi:hypothetical protein